MQSHPVQTQVISMDGAWRDAALAQLRQGAVVAVPTETVYGLAGDATSADAVAKIFAAKGRPSHNPLIAHVADSEMARDLALVSPVAQALIAAVWPGPLTLVLPLKAEASATRAVTAGGDSIALRCPKGAIRELSAALGKPIAAPSANRSGHVSPTRAEHVLADLDGRIPLIVDGGATAMGLESTILDARGDKPMILRPGALTQDAIAKILSVSVSDVTVADSAVDAPAAPGLLASHYAPAVPVRLDVLPSDLREGEAYLGFGDHTLPEAMTLSLSGDLTEAAAKLYEALRTLDAQNPASIAVAPIPNEGLGHAINNRLKRAAAPRRVP
ncbi:MAG: L-threonylcarbamoyladenylate synthase [Pseudomonadota bacterium]